MLGNNPKSRISRGLVQHTGITRRSEAIRQEDWPVSPNLGLRRKTLKNPRMTQSSRRPQVAKSPNVLHPLPEWARSRQAGTPKDMAKGCKRLLGQIGNRKFPMQHFGAGILGPQ